MTARKVQSFADMRQYVGLISHNCVKCNGRETDYGMVAREFEAMADEVIRQAVTAAENAPTAAPAVATVAPVPAASAAVVAATAVAAAATVTATAAPPPEPTPKS